MPSHKPETIYLKNYTPPAYLIDSVDLSFDLYEENCIVQSRLSCKINPYSTEENAPFFCYGENLELVSISINKQSLKCDDYIINEESLTIKKVPKEFILEVKTKIEPQNNHSLEGLYKSGSMYCTQCEPEGFRRITYFPDRPDVMALYSVRITADKQKYPVLLSNGNPVESGDLDNGRHWIKWEDPFKKPSYLFALVAGDLLCIKDKFVTRSGRSVRLEIYTEKENIDKCDHAMRCLKQAMKWDEDVYDREYDLDIFMIVAVNNFNAGAMENKGLNIFNSKLVLAKPETATDNDYSNIQGVIAHEYFHNWTGNRITCRDWFQLSLKEGLTIFRDQQFSSDMTSKAAKRISDVKYLRTVQFAEDSGPMAHQVRPDSFIEINNFYTVTVYEKGSELIRMISLLLGEKGFYRGMKLYFDRHDGQAVTIEDFVKAMEDANNADLSQFSNWYTQAGTPEIHVETKYDGENKTFDLILKQTCPLTPGQEKKQPFQIPIEVGLLGSNGEELSLYLDDDPSQHGQKSITLDFKQSEQCFRFSDLSSKPIPSIIRGFTAPVKLTHHVEEDELVFLMSHDTDEFNRWDSAQRLITKIMLRLIDDIGTNRVEIKDLVEILPNQIPDLIDAFRNVLLNESLDKAIISQTIALPTEAYLAEQMEIIDVEAIHSVREAMKKVMVESLRKDFENQYHFLHSDEKPSYDHKSIGKRSLKNLALSYLMALDDEDILALCLKQYENANNMTDEIAALTLLADKNYPNRHEAILSFYEKWKADPLVMDMWLSIQASSSLTKLSDIKKLTEHPVFDFKNPNKLRSLIGVYCGQNQINFHTRDGSSYEFLGDKIIKLDKMNPQIAARLLTPFTRLKKYDENRQTLMKSQLKRILEITSVSRNVYEIASKSLI